LYLDVNGSGHFQDPDVGLHSVKIFLDNGESVVTDSTGRYDYPCVIRGCMRCGSTSGPSLRASCPTSIATSIARKSTRRLVHHIYDTTIIEDINFAVTGTPEKPSSPAAAAPSRNSAAAACPPCPGPRRPEQGWVKANQSELWPRNELTCAGRAAGAIGA